MANSSNKMEFIFIEHNGLRIRLGHKNLGLSNPPLLLLGGIGVPMEVATPFINALPNHPIISLDIPGVGHSTSPRKPYRLSTMASLVSELLTKQQIDHVDVLGVSWGGALAQQFVKDFPERCRKLILAATSSGPLMIPAQPAALLKLTPPGTLLARQTMSLFMPQLLAPLTSPQPGPDGSTHSTMQPNRTRGYLYQLMAIFGWTSIHWLHRIKLPTLVLTGTNDQIVPPANSYLLRKRIPNATSHTLTGSHLFMLEHPEKVAALIKEFLSNQ